MSSEPYRSFQLSRWSSQRVSCLLGIFTLFFMGCNRPAQDSPSVAAQGALQTQVIPPVAAAPGSASSTVPVVSGASRISGTGVNSTAATSTSTPQNSGSHESGHAISPCSSEEISSFTRDEGEHFDPLSLPTGLYVASTIQMFLEKSNSTVNSSSSEAPSRVFIREVVGGDKGVEIVCADGLEKFGNDFDFSMTGLVKFVTNAQKVAGDFAFRQVFFYQNRLDSGAIVSNPQLSSQTINPVAPVGSLGLTELLRHGTGLLSRIGDSSYRIKYVRERESGLHAKLMIDLDAN